MLSPPYTQQHQMFTDSQLSFSSLLQITGLLSGFITECFFCFLLLNRRKQMSTSYIFNSFYWIYLAYCLAKQLSFQAISDKPRMQFIDRIRIVTYGTHVLCSSSCLMFLWLLMRADSKFCTSLLSTAWTTLFTLLFKFSSAQWASGIRWSWRAKRQLSAACITRSHD